MTDKDLPTIEYLHKRLCYEPETGKLFWRDCEEMQTQWRARWAGKEAFTANDKFGYKHGRIRNLGLKASRVAWAIFHGEWPIGLIDHMNGIKGDNRMTNLRVVTEAENMRNKSMQHNNTSGFTGVSRQNPSGKWRARIKINGRTKHLGYFSTLEGAATARAEASRQHGFTDRHGT